MLCDSQSKILCHTTFGRKAVTMNAHCPFYHIRGTVFQKILSKNFSIIFLFSFTFAFIFTTLFIVFGFVWNVNVTTSLQRIFSTKKKQNFRSLRINIPLNFLFLVFCSLFHQPCSFCVGNLLCANAKKINHSENVILRNYLIG